MASMNNVVNILSNLHETFSPRSSPVLKKRCRFFQDKSKKVDVLQIWNGRSNGPSSERNINGYTVRNTAGVTGYGNGDV